MRCACVVRMLEEDGSSRIVASWLNFPPIIIWFMANMDDKLLDEKLHLFDLNKLSLLCGACRKILQSPNWLQEACRLWGEDENTVDEAKAFCFKEVMHDILLQGEMIPPPQNGAQLVCHVSRKMPT